MVMRFVAVAGLLLAGFSFGASQAQARGGATTSESCLPGVIKSRLAQVRKNFGAIQVVSTHRPGAKIAGTRNTSYHASCRAADFVPPKGKYGVVTRWLYANHEGGVGTYTCMNHIHIDNGPHVRWTKCR
jgi:uncharacterized protein YcbK (DUF882 family)